jgi:hypothetical protein
MAAHSQWLVFLYALPSFDLRAPLSIACSWRCCDWRRKLYPTTIPLARHSTILSPIDYLPQSSHHTEPSLDPFPLHECLRNGRLAACNHVVHLVAFLF